MPTTVRTKLQPEAPMSVPNVDRVIHGDITYFFNGWVGDHVTSGLVFEFEDSTSSSKIWVDVNGKFVCVE